MNFQDVQLQAANHFLNEMRSVHQRNYQVAVSQKINITPELVLKGILCDLIRFPIESVSGMLADMARRDASLAVEYDEAEMIMKLIEALALDLTAILLDLYKELPAAVGAESGPGFFKAYIAATEEHSKKILSMIVRQELTRPQGGIVLPGKPN